MSHVIVAAKCGGPAAVIKPARLRVAGCYGRNSIAASVTMQQTLSQTQM